MFYGLTFEIIFVLPIKNKKNKDGTPHKQRPDIDNLLKGFMDAILEEDSFVWNVSIQKKWGNIPKIIINQ